MNIYIYGNEKFKSNIKSILTKANLGINIEVINTLFAIKVKLENSQKDIFIIDESKIISPNFITKKMKFLFPSDGIEREMIEKFGVGDVCFNSINGMIGYINSRIKLEEKEPKIEASKEIKTLNENLFNTVEFKNVYDEDDYDPLEDQSELLSTQEEEIPRDLTMLKTIDDIRDDEIVNEMFNHNKA